MGRIGEWLRAQPSWVLVVLALGVGVRVAIGLIVIPDVQSEWFAPFVSSFLNGATLDPWQAFLDLGGDSAAFPYGPVMLAYFAAAGALTSWIPDPWGVQLGIFFGLLVLEMALYFLVALWSRTTSRVALLLLSTSPIAIYATYIHGQLDLLPTVLVFASVFSLTRQRWTLGGVLLGLAIAAKFSSVLVAPLVLIFLLRNIRYRAAIRPFLLGIIPGSVLAIAPVILPGYRAMVVATPTGQSIFTYALELGPGLTVVVLPLVYTITLGYQYWLRRSNTDLLGMLIGLMLTAVTLLTPASPGWYLWALPFLATYASRMNARVPLALLLFWSVATTTLAARASGGIVRWSTEVEFDGPFGEVGNFVSEIGSVGPLLSTATVLTGSVVIVLMFRESRRLHDLYRLNSAPLSIAIAGDSGTGKDTASSSLSAAFGSQSTAILMGDDYHRYDRSSPLWKITTHLHPSANDLATLADDAVRMMSGQAVVSRHYDHSRGRFTKRSLGRRGDLVVLNGLHMLGSLAVREAADLTVFMSMDERLRRRLKIERDTRERGHTLEAVVRAIERRYSDVDTYIRPQEAVADLILHLAPTSELPPESEPILRWPEFVLDIDIVDSSFIRSLHTSLISIAGCPASLHYDAKPGRVRLTVMPNDLRSADIASIAERLIEHPDEIFVSSPNWLGGSSGLIQLVLVLAVLERRKASRR